MLLMCRILLAFVLTHQATGARTHRFQVRPALEALTDEQEEEFIAQLNQLGMIDIDSEMSHLLADSGVIREDIINKPGDKYTLKIDTSKFKRNPFTHGMLEFGGAYGGALGGISVGGLPGMAAGGLGGFKAGERAADTLDSILQGHASIGISEDWKERSGGSALTKRLRRYNAHREPLETPSTFQGTTPLAQSLPPQTSFMSSIRNIFRMGNRSTTEIDSIMTNMPSSQAIQSFSTPGNTPSTNSMASLFRPNTLSALMAMEDTEIKVIDGLDADLKSGDAQKVEDAQITTAMLSILRHTREGDTVEVIDKKEGDAVEVIIK